uniref:Ornithine decarboxylase n=1 Tax=Dracunculus medinensis TaxID=318479 RepID=A0A0N4U8K2_DRAME
LPSVRYENFANNPILIYNEEKSLRTVARHFADYKTIQADNGSFFVMDVGRIDELMQYWCISLPRVQPFYALQCNSDPVLLHLLAHYPNFGFFCASGDDVEKALDLIGIDRIIYGNPLWTRRNVCKAKEYGLQCLICQSENDLMRVKAFHPDANVILRVCIGPVENRLRIGCDLIDEAPLLIELCSKINIHLVGIGFSVCVGNLSLGLYAYAIAQCRRLFDLAAEFGILLNILDIGDFPSTDMSTGLSFNQISEIINSALFQYFPDDHFVNLRIIAEPGRYFASSAFALVTNVIGTYITRASLLTNTEIDVDEVVIVYKTNDGIYKSFGCILAEDCEPHCEPLHDDETQVITYVSIIGNTVENEVLQPITRLKSLKVGDWLLWNNMGAYTMYNRDKNCRNSLPVVHYFTDSERWAFLRKFSSISKSMSHGKTNVENLCEKKVDDEFSINSEVESFVSEDDDSIWARNSFLREDNEE